MGNLRGLILARVTELADDLHGCRGTAFGRHLGRGENINAFFLIERAEHDLELRISENAGEGEDTGGRSHGATEEEPVKGVARDCRLTATVAGGDGIDTNRDVRPGVKKRIIGRATRGRGGGVELVATGAATSEDTGIAETELPE